MAHRVRRPDPTAVRIAVDTLASGSGSASSVLSSPRYRRGRPHSRPGDGAAGSSSTEPAIQPGMTPEDAYDWYPLQERVGILELADAGAIDLDESLTTSITVVGEQDELAIVIPADVVAALDSVPPGELHERINAAARVAAERR